MNPITKRPSRFKHAGIYLVLMALGFFGPGLQDAGAQKIKCRAPGTEAMRAMAAKISTKTLASIVKATGSFETKVQRIRNVSPKGATFDIIAYRLCEAAQNKLITREFYQKYLLTAIRPVGAGAAGEKWNLSGDVYVRGKRTTRLANAEVELGFEPPRITATAPDGTFSFAMSEEDAGKAVVLRARKSGYEIFVSRVVLKPNMDSLKIPLRPLKDTFVLNGRVIRRAGNRSLSAARVTLNTDPPAEARTRSDGRFRFDVDRENLEKFVSLRVERKGYRPYVKDIRLAEKRKPVIVRLDRAVFRLRGSIRDRDSQAPLEGVRITLMTEPATRTLSRSDGKFLLRVPLELDGEFAVLRAQKHGYRTFTMDVELVSEGGEPVEVEMSLAE